MSPQQDGGILTVLPGDNVTDTIRSTTKKNLKLGVGLRYSTDKILATRAGRLQHRRDTWFVLQSNKRYIPMAEDRVVGIVQDRAGSDDGGGGDVYRVHIGGPHPALLSNLDFEGATKRNRPTLKPGALVYGRIVSTIMDPVLSCQLGPKDVGVPRKDWMTQEGLYGELKGGTLQKLEIGLARELLSPTNVVLEELSKLPFEICIGVNGYLWIHSEHPSYTILVNNAILNSQVLTEEQTRAMVQSLTKTVKQQMSSDD